MSSFASPGASTVIKDHLKKNGDVLAVVYVIVELIPLTRLQAVGLMHIISKYSCPDVNQCFETWLSAHAVLLLDESWILETVAEHTCISSVYLQ